MEVNSDRKKNKANLITVSESPLCQEADFTAMNSVVTPTDDFYVRSHFASVPGDKYCSLARSLTF